MLKACADALCLFGNIFFCLQNPGLPNLWNAGQQNREYYTL